MRDVSAHVGRAVHSDQVVNVNSGEMWLSLDPSADGAATVDAVQHVLANYPGLSHDVLTYPEDRMTDVLEGTDEDVVVRIYGPEGAVRQAKAEEVRTLLSGIEGIERPTVETAPTEPTLEIEVDLQKAQRYGIKPGDVRRSSAWPPARGSRRSSPGRARTALARVGNADACARRRTASSRPRRALGHGGR